MKDLESLARVAQAEKIIYQAIADVPLAYTPLEVAAAIQGLGLRLAEACLPPRAIARNLIDQAEGYLKYAGDIQPANDVGPRIDDMTEKAHRILTSAAKAMETAGIPLTEGRHLMLGFAAAWMAKGDTQTAAENLYRTADTLIGRGHRGTTH